VRLAAKLHPAVRQALSLSVWQKMPGSHPKSRLTRFKRFIRPLSLSAGSRYARYMELFSPAQLRRLYRADISEADEVYVAGAFDALAAEREDVPAAAAVDRVTYLPEDLLVKVDRCSMQHALEVRNPFMDTELVQYAAGLDTGQLLGGGSKTLLRHAFAGDLPPGHFDRPKMGFAVPIGEWLRTDLREMLNDLCNAENSFTSACFDRAYLSRLVSDHEHGRQDHSQRLYAILVLELWWARHGVK
jgi:asparagine synthase (glutamine-hydrolysing)